MRVLGLCLVLALGACAPTPRASLEDAPALPSVSAGHIERVAIQPRELPPRPVDVWLPPGYPTAAPYPVIYMQDGQMLFDAGITWNRQEWRVDEVAAELIANGEVPAFIVVGVWNAGPDRQREYFPQRVYEALEEGTRETLRRQQRAQAHHLVRHRWFLWSGWISKLKPKPQTTGDAPVLHHVAGHDHPTPIDPKYTAARAAAA